MAEVPKKIREAFAAQCESYVAFPIENADDLLDLPKKARERVLLDVHIEDLLKNRPSLRMHPRAVLESVVRKWLVEEGIL